MSRLLLRLLACAALAAGAAHASFTDRFKDPDDGAFDMSSWLLDHRGALPVPIVITEPAVGYGGGIALAFFSESMSDAARKAAGGRVTPPNIYVGAVFGTENGSKGGGVGGRMSFDHDTWRYKGGLGAASINLDFYGVGGVLGPGVGKIAYTLKGAAVFQELVRRMGDSDHFLGMRYRFFDVEANLDADAMLTERERAQRSSEVGVLWNYDSRDNIFSPRKGLDFGLEAMFASPSIGSDNSYQTYRARAFLYTEPVERFIAAYRLDGRTARGDVPFYQLPFIDLRGIPAARYQDENVGVVETELRYYVTPRWIAVGFIGAARAWGRRDSFGDSGTQVGKGAGFRYVVARRLGLAVGIDVARGPEETAWYLKAGASWR